MGREGIVRQTLGHSASQIPLAAVIALLAFASPLCAAELDSDIGVILALNGKPVLQNTSGRLAPSAAMQAIHEDDVILFNAGDSVTICNEALGSTVEIDGPGTVRLARSAVVIVTGSPGIRNAGPCEAGVTGDTNGGVLLRQIKPKQFP